jgi:hypothetical protein
MKKYPYLMLLVLAACTTQKDQVSEAPDMSDSSFILDSLLVYDSEQALVNRFGKENIARDTMWYPEGMGQYMVTLLYPGTNNEVIFTWLDSGSYMGLESVTVLMDSSAWSTRGVKIGTTMEELIELNGGHFTFSGFGWDYGGYPSWGDNGKLRGLEARLYSSEEMMAQEQLDSLMGDQTVSTKSTAARINNPVVSELKVLKQRDE